MSAKPDVALFLAGVPVIYPGAGVAAGGTDGTKFRAQFVRGADDGGMPPYVRIWQVGLPGVIASPLMNELGARNFFLNLDEVELQQ